MYTCIDSVHYNSIVYIYHMTLLFIIEKLLVGFVALRPKSTAMVIAGRSVHLITLFPGQA